MTPCALCGGEMTTPHVVTTTGLLEGDWDCHERCYDDFLVGFERRRRQFADLIDAGVPRDEANRLMIARIDGAASS